MNLLVLSTSSSLETAEKLLLLNFQRIKIKEILLDIFKFMALQMHKIILKWLFGQGVKNTSWHSKINKASLI